MRATVPTTIPTDSPQPRLPLDIQLAIVDACPDVRTRLMLISTHKTLRKRGARLAVESPSAPVRIHSKVAARSFFVFCAAQGLPSEPSSPLAVLHTLDITLATVNPVGMGHLIILLGNVPRLTSLTLYDPEEALRRYPALYAALRHLRTLKAFKVQQADIMSFRLVSEIASALETVGLLPDWLTSRTVFLDFDVVLGPHKDTLTHVELRTNIQTEMELPRTYDSRVVFEKVQKLVLPVCLFPGASRFIKAFPNAVTLHVGNSRTDRLNPNSPRTALEGMRSWNLLAVLRQHGADPSLSLPDIPDCWPSLETVRGGLFDLYVFGNCCSVATLEIDGLIESDWEYVATVVQAHYPVILRLSVTASLQADVWEKEWRSLCSVKFLILQFVVEEDGEMGILTDMVIRAVGAFVHCKYVFLDFKAGNADGKSRLLRLNHLALVPIIEDRQLGPFDMAIRSPTNTSCWSHSPYVGKTRESLWDIEDWPAKTNFQTLHGFPKSHVTDDWV